MKFKVVDFRVYRELTGQALFPADATDEYIESVLRKTATHEVDRWYVDDWNAECFAIAAVDLPASSCVPDNSFFQKDTTFVADLKNKVLTNPEEANWWIATEEEKAEEQTPQPVDPNQLPLFKYGFGPVQ